MKKYEYLFIFSQLKCSYKGTIVPGEPFLLVEFLLYRYRHFFQILASCEDMDSQAWKSCSAGLMLLRILDAKIESDPDPAPKEIKALDHIIASVADADLSNIFVRARGVIRDIHSSDAPPTIDQILQPFNEYAEWLESSPDYTLAEDVRETIERAVARMGQRRRKTIEAAE